MSKQKEPTLSPQLAQELAAGPQSSFIKLNGLDDPRWLERCQLAASRPPAPAGTANQISQGGGAVAITLPQGDPARVSGMLLLTPTFLNGVQVLSIVPGFPADSEQAKQLGVMLRSQRWLVQTMLWRSQQGEWEPVPGIDPGTAWLALNVETGKPAPPGLAEELFRPVLRAAELLYRAQFRQFVLAEAGAIQELLEDWKRDNELMRQVVQKGRGKGEPTEEAKQAQQRVYKLRFSGKIGEARQQLAQLVQYLERGAGTVSA